MANVFQTPELALGIAVGGAAGAAFEPKLEVPKQTAWAANPQRLPDLGLIAALIAGGKVSMADGQNMANRLGFSDGTMETMVWLAQNRLDFPVMLRMWRLAAVNPAFDDATLSALFDKTIAHDQLDWDYRPYLRALKTAELIGLGDIAAAIVRGAVPAPSWVPVAPPTTTDKVPRFPVTDLDPVKLAAALGFDEDMLRIMTARSGLSLAPILATQARYRGVLSANDWLLAIAEGDLRTEWADTLYEAAREIPTLGQMMEHALRGFEDIADAKTNAKRHGTTPADAQLVYDNLGRAPNIHAVTTGLARGGTYDGQPKTIPEPYLSAVRRADIRPEWYDVEYANRFSYPSAFVLRALAQAGELGDAAAVEQILAEIGWPPDLRAKVATAWTSGGAAGDAHVTKAANQLWTATHKAYLNSEASDADVTQMMNLIGVSATAQPQVLALWQAERSLVRKGLTAANYHKAFSKGDTNDATGQPWTRDETIAELMRLGYSQQEAGQYLDIP